METLFRLMLTRPAVEQNEATPSIRLAQNTQFQAALAQAWQDNIPEKALKAASEKYVKSKNFVASPKNLGISAELTKLSGILDDLGKKKNPANSDVVKAIEEAFNSKPAEIIKNKITDAAAEQIKDSIIAIKFLPPEHKRPIEALTNQLRDIELIHKVHTDKKFPESSFHLKRFRRRSVLLPTENELNSALRFIKHQEELEKKRRQEEEKKRKEAEAKLTLYNNLKKAIRELTALGEEHFNTTPQKESEGFNVPAELSPLNVYSQAIKQQVQFSQFNLVAAQLMMGKATGKSKPFTAASDFSAETAKAPNVSSNFEGLFQSGSPKFIPLKLPLVSFMLKPTASKNLSQSTLQILKARNLSIADQSLDHIVQILRTEITSLVKELDQLFGSPVKHSLKRIGNTLVKINTPMPSAWNNILTGYGASLTVSLDMDMRIPHSHGNVTPAGIADLLVIKQQLVRYEGTDVAHIENVLKGEKKEREHTRRRETEELIFRETEVTTSEERSLETTSRFELSRETSETIKEEASLKAGFKISGKYGPVVEFAASAEGSLSRTKETATKAASKFSQDVTERSASKVTQRILERSSLKVTNEVTEKNAHGIDNTGGAGHIAGVYQWVNKVYQAQMYNYGLRAMFDFMVPEPGAFLIEAMQSAHAAALEIEKPITFSLRPDQINESNYHFWIQAYGATGVNPPPEMYVTKTLHFKAGGGDSSTEYNHSGQIDIDEGYKAIYGVVGTAATIWESNYLIDVVLSNRAHRIQGSEWVWSTGLNDVTGSVAFGLQTRRVKNIAAILEVKTQRTSRAMMNWRLDTHAKLTNAYKAKLAEYEEKISQLEMQAGVAITGKNPELNAELMKDELKKNCISILTEQHFELFNAISTGSHGMPQINLYENEAEGPYVRFFEQAFEWEHITWVNYPYFWGRKSKWAERVSYEDNDPVFNEFLKAGYCRVSVPARPGFEGAIDHFITYGEIWNGGPLPAISSPLYLPIADELAERLDRPGEEIPQGDPWMVRIPTSLVHLRPDDKLPVWEQNDQGEWLEVNQAP